MARTRSRRHVLQARKLTVKPLTQRLFACCFDNCVAVFSKPYALRSHERSHTGERPYVCSLCSKAFPWRSGLHYHVTNRVCCATIAPPPPSLDDPVFAELAPIVQLTDEPEDAIICTGSVPLLTSTTRTHVSSLWELATLFNTTSATSYR